MFIVTFNHILLVALFLIFQDSLDQVSKANIEEQLFSKKSKAEETDKIIKDTSKEFEVNVYENILDVLRSKELEILNTKRAQEIEDLQVSNPRWFELKTEQFCQELKRNRLRGQANQKTEKRLVKLMDNTLY